MTRKLFFDTDCLSAFLWTNKTAILHELYGGRIVLPEPVYQELSNPCIPHIKQKINRLIEDQIVSVQQIDVGTEEFELYRQLVNGSGEMMRIGRGEAAGIALAKGADGILASNNYQDISSYIQKYSLKHTDTGHILADALEKGLITEEEGNGIWQNMLSKKRKLPTETFSDYLKKYIG